MCQPPHSLVEIEKTVCPLQLRHINGLHSMVWTRTLISSEQSFSLCRPLQKRQFSGLLTYLALLPPFDGFSTPCEFPSIVEAYSLASSASLGPSILSVVLVMPSTLLLAISHLEALLH
ncbi:hypothetical protein V6N11_010400 [Hibiscus sabdariffa]|uniref:Uncharacterized protein n=1 Tax=Hibiscus sabdariffa TaxID=183260 RepID=A0ABR2S5T5_9ROSI